MAQVSVEVPAVLVGPVRETVLLLYQATAEALHFALRAHSEGRAELEEVLQHRERLGQLDELLGQLGWSDEPARSDPVEATAPYDVMHDALYGALIDAGERLATACERSWRGEAGGEEVGDAAGEVIALDRLLRRVRE
jgi:hypothetical protein